MATACAEYSRITKDDAQENNPIIRKCAMEKAKAKVKANPNIEGRTFDWVDYSVKCSNKNGKKRSDEDETICEALSKETEEEEGELRKQLKERFEGEEEARDDLYKSSKYNTSFNDISPSVKAILPYKLKSKPEETKSLLERSLKAFGIRGGKKRKMESKKKRRKNKNRSKKTKTKSRSQHFSS